MDSSSARRNACGLESQDGHTIRWRVVWSMTWGGLGHVCISDTDLLAERGNLLFGLIALIFVPDAGIDAIGSPALGRYDSVVGQGEDVQDG